MSKSKLNISVLMLLLVFFNGMAQQHLDPEYIKVTNERAAKIVEKLELANPAKEKAVTDIIAQQFRDLSEIQDGRDAEIKKVKADASLAKEKQNEKIDELKSNA